MNLVIMRLTWRALIGRKRIVFLAGLPLLLLGIAALTGAKSGGSLEASAALASSFTLGTFTPLMCLLIGTGVIAPEIEDGSIVYLLSKPIPRRTIVFSKLAVAFVASAVLCILPACAATLIAGDDGGQLTGAFGLTIALATVAYLAVFFAISLLSKSPIIVGLIYALMWETTLGGLAPGVRNVSIRQWALSAGERVLDPWASLYDATSDVSLVTGMVLIVLTTVGAVIVSIRRLKRLRLKTAD